MVSVAAKKELLPDSLATNPVEKSQFWRALTGETIVANEMVFSNWSVPERTWNLKLSSLSLLQTKRQGGLH